MLIDSVKTVVEQRLSVLLGQRFRLVMRASAMGNLGFGDDIKSIDFHGEERILAKYALHIQCSFRILDAERVLIANLDMFEPRTQIEYAENYNWDAYGKNIYDEKGQTFTKNVTDHSIIVTAVKASHYGDLRIELSNGCSIETFNNLSINEEIWRFFEVGVDAPHFVVTGQGIEE